MAGSYYQTLKINKLSMGADHYTSLLPAVGRIHMRSLSNEFNANFNNTLYCKSCLTLFRPQNHSVKIKRRMRLSKRLQKLKTKEKTKHHHLSEFQRRMLVNFDNRSTRLIIRCHSCKYNSVFFFPKKGEKLTIKETVVEEPKKMSKKKLKQKLKRIRDRELVQGNKTISQSGLTIDDSVNKSKNHCTSDSVAEMHNMTDGKSTKKQKKSSKHGQSLNKLLEEKSVAKSSNNSASALQSFFAAFD